MLIQLPPIDFNIASVSMFRWALAAASDRPAVRPVLTPKSSMSRNACVASETTPGTGRSGLPLTHWALKAKKTAHSSISLDSSLTARVTFGSERSNFCCAIVVPDATRSAKHVSAVFMNPSYPQLAHAAERHRRVLVVHSMTSSARASSDGGTSRLRALAVLRLMTNSNLVGTCTGSSAGFSPLRMRST